MNLIKTTVKVMALTLVFVGSLEITSANTSILQNQFVKQELQDDIPTAEEVLKSTQESTTYGKVILPKEMKSTYGSYNFYPVFENKNEALLNFQNDMKEEINIVKTAFNLPLLTAETYEKYYSATKEMVESGLISYENINKMLSFYATFDNYKLNDEVRNAIENADYKKDQKAKILVDEISPLYNKRLTNVVMPNVANTRSIGLPNLSGAVNYAKKYAVNANTAYKNFSSSGGDCTNFTSQILLNGGIGMVNTNNANTGWWYKNGTNYSISWVRADTFTRYMGRSYRGAWSNIVKDLHAGAFIAADFNGDYYVDHMAFVTSKVSDSKVWIAQHSSAYHKISSETGWPSEKNVWMVR